MPLRASLFTLDNKRYFYRVLKKIIREADHIVTVSEFTKQDVMDIFDIKEDRITNTWQAVAVDPYFMSLSDDDVADVVSHRYGLTFKEYFCSWVRSSPRRT